MRQLTPVSTPESSFLLFVGPPLTAYLVDLQFHGLFGHQPFRLFSSTVAYASIYYFVAKFEVFTAVKTQVEVFWVVTLCSVSIFTLQREDGGSMVLRNVDILPHHYTASQPRRPRHACISLSNLLILLAYTTLD
jgi:hypothetical protein